MVVLSLCFTGAGVVVGFIAQRFVLPMPRNRSSMLVFGLSLYLGTVVGLVLSMFAPRFVPLMPPTMPPPSPLLRPFGDNKDWIVSEDIAYRIGDTADFIVVPRGFVTDFASIP